MEEEKRQYSISEELIDIAMTVNAEMRAEVLPSNIYFSLDEEIKKLESLLRFNDFGETVHVEYMREKIKNALKGWPIILHPSLEKLHHKYWIQQELPDPRDPLGMGKITCTCGNENK